ncbi:alcohol acetyltransferase [Apiospora hydei]|uniref:Alcohol acetyltransferase n=1 Tax=Apiospora hydei TaxID=1337664 RepID=A0ABR1WBG1_9PEZI
MANYVTVSSHVLDETVVADVRFKTSLASEGCVRSSDFMDIIWTVAHKVRGEINTKLEQGFDNDIIGFWQVIDDWNTQLLEEARRPRRSSWVVTNLGLIDGTPTLSSSALPDAGEPTLTGVADRMESGWSIIRAQFLMGANVGASALGISTVAVKGGDLVVTCSWQDCVIEKRVGDAFVASLERWLKFTAEYPDGWPNPFVDLP